MELVGEKLKVQHQITLAQCPLIGQRVHRDSGARVAAFHPCAVERVQARTGIVGVELINLGLTHMRLAVLGGVDSDRGNDHHGSGVVVREQVEGRHQRHHAVGPGT